MKSILNELALADIEAIKARAAVCDYRDGEMIFAEGNVADSLYFVEAGQVQIFIEEFNSRQPIELLGPGEFFGEMAMFNRNRRMASACAKTDTRLLVIDQQSFLELAEAERDIAASIQALLVHRSEELVLKEKLIDATCAAGDLHIGIKGDPSLRESALFRERYESPVDQIMTELTAAFEDLLLNRSAYRIHVCFNSGEIRISTILDPFNEEFHPAKRLLDETYVARHFPVVDYEHKSAIIRRVFGIVSADGFFIDMPDHLQNIFRRHYANWTPVPREEVASTVRRFPTLRSIPNFYVRNATIGMVKDAIHMQFNCDGAHIVSAANYERFLQENL